MRELGMVAEKEPQDVRELVAVTGELLDEVEMPDSCPVLTEPSQRRREVEARQEVVRILDERLLERRAGRLEPVFGLSVRGGVELVPALLVYEDALPARRNVGVTDRDRQADAE